MFQIIIKVDINDGDYATSIHEISKKDLELVRPLIKAIKESPNRHNYEKRECNKSGIREIYKFADEVHDIFDDLLPYCDQGFHTIVSVIVSEIVSQEVLI